jgi:hypothetical protein
MFAIQNGKPVTASDDSILLIPMKPEETQVHEEVCHLGRRSDDRAMRARTD